MRIVAGIGMVKAVKDRHQRRFAGAILADDAVDRALCDREIDVLVGVNRPEALVDADQLDGWRNSVAHTHALLLNGPPAASLSCRGPASTSAQ